MGRKSAQSLMYRERCLAVEATGAVESDGAEISSPNLCCLITRPMGRVCVSAMNPSCSRIVRVWAAPVTGI